MSDKTGEIRHSERRFGLIEMFYDLSRIDSALGGLSPDQYGEMNCFA